MPTLGYEDVVKRWKEKKITDEVSLDSALSNYRILFDEDKETYYLALAVFDQTEKLDGFVGFLKEQTVKTWVKESPLRSKKTKKIICL